MNQPPRSKKKIKCSIAYDLYLLGVSMGYGMATKDSPMQHLVSTKVQGLLNETELKELLAHVARSKKNNLKEKEKK